MIFKRTHFLATYYLPSWQGGDIEYPLCRRPTFGAPEAEETLGRLVTTTVADRVDCAACRTMLSGGPHRYGRRKAVAE
jgi:hypothetical protein